MSVMDEIAKFTLHEVKTLAEKFEAERRNIISKKRPWQEGWKAVQVLSSKVGGSLLLDPPSPGYSYYPLGKITYPQKNCGPLSLFRNEEEAWLFLKDNFGMLPVKVQAGVMQVKYIPSDFHILWRLFDSKEGTGFGIMRGNWVPQGTCFAQRVKPIGWSSNCPYDWLIEKSASRIYLPKAGS